MAKVKITGHASGTGVITVTAPNTSTDRTITLPDGTGTLIADDGSGNVGIGTSSPSYPLHLATTGSTSAQMGISNTGTGEAGLYFDASNGDFLGSDYAWIAQNNDLSLEITTGALSNAPIILKTNDSERLRIDSDGLKFNGDTAAANALDDYEEGTWTPVVRDTSLAGSIVTSTVNATYTKIGRFVYVQAYVTRASSASLTGDMIITGLPYAVAGSTTPMNGNIWFDNVSTDYMAFCYGNSSAIYPKTLTTGAYLKSNNWENNRPFYLGFTYET